MRSRSSSRSSDVRTTTVRRYTVSPGRVDRVGREADVVHAIRPRNDAIEAWQRETNIYETTPGPLVVRQLAPPPTIVVRRPSPDAVVVRKSVTVVNLDEE